MAPTSDEIWSRIISCEGEVFTQIRGGEFTYGVKGNQLRLSRTNQSLSRSQIESALEFVPLADTKPVQHLRAPAYIYAILMDARIRQGNW